MAHETSATVLRTFIEAWNERDFDRGAAVVEADAELVEVATGESFRGPEGARQEFEKWATALPDGKIEIKNLIEAGEWAVSEAIMRGTNTGPITTEAGEIAPTGRTIELQFSNVWQVKGSKVVAGNHYYDSATMMRQLGLMPEVAVGA